MDTNSNNIRLYFLFLTMVLCWFQGGAGEAECVGGPAEPGEHVRHRGEPKESV